MVVGWQVRRADQNTLRAVQLGPIAAPFTDTAIWSTKDTCKGQYTRTNAGSCLALGPQCVYVSQHTKFS